MSLYELATYLELSSTMAIRPWHKMFLHMYMRILLLIKRILQLAHEIHGQVCLTDKSHKRKDAFSIYHFIMILLLFSVTNHMDVSTFIIDTFTDYELILDFVDRVPL